MIIPGKFLASIVKLQVFQILLTKYTLFSTGVSVGSFKEQFERRASLTSGSIPVSTNEVKKPATKTVQSPTTPTVAANKMLANKKIHSVDSEHPDSIVPNNVNKESPNVRLQHIGVEPIAQVNGRQCTY